ncbi:Uncharacterised protein [Mycobacteroides abscessus subsp. abscessus]|nr:Uncharacterised protein [Mycobacteroides abscessus subsp. abscessus]
MVEPEQRLEQLRVFLAGFGFVEDLQLAVHHDLAAVGDVEEHRLDPFAGACLVDGGGDGGGVGVLEGARHLADLVAAVVQPRCLVRRPGPASPRATA